MIHPGHSYSTQGFGYALVHLERLEAHPTDKQQAARQCVFAATNGRAHFACFALTLAASNAPS
jgi:hypothetical protein